MALHIENLQIGKWYILTTLGNSITGMPLKIVELNPPFVLVKDIDRDMMVIDTRVHTVASVTPSFMRKFRTLWKETKQRRMQNNMIVCERCGTPCEPIQDE